MVIFHTCSVDAKTTKQLTTLVQHVYNSYKYNYRYVNLHPLPIDTSIINFANDKQR
jgi:hypothetical protein